MSPSSVKMVDPNLLALFAHIRPLPDPPRPPSWFLTFFPVTLISSLILVRARGLHLTGALKLAGRGWGVGGGGSWAGKQCDSQSRGPPGDKMHPFSYDSANFLFSWRFYPKQLTVDNVGLRALPPGCWLPHSAVLGSVLALCCWAGFWSHMSDRNLPCKGDRAWNSKLHNKAVGRTQKHQMGNESEVWRKLKSRGVAPQRKYVITLIVLLSKNCEYRLPGLISFSRVFRGVKSSYLHSTFHTHRPFKVL